MKNAFKLANEIKRKTEELENQLVVTPLNRLHVENTVSQIHDSVDTLMAYRKPAPKWVGALVHAKNALLKHGVKSSAYDHIDKVLNSYRNQD